VFSLPAAKRFLPFPKIAVLAIFEKHAKARYLQGRLLHRREAQSSSQKCSGKLPCDWLWACSISLRFDPQD
jgi:hypothetical protein